MMAPSVAWEDSVSGSSWVSCAVVIVISLIRIFLNLIKCRLRFSLARCHIMVATIL